MPGSYAGSDSTRIVVKPGRSCDDVLAYSRYQNNFSSNNTMDFTTFRVYSLIVVSGFYRGLFSFLPVWIDMPPFITPRASPREYSKNRKSFATIGSLSQ